MGLLLFLLLEASFGSSLIYDVGGTFVSFHKEDAFFVNSSCEKKCEAYKRAMKFKDKKISSADRRGGKNPSSVKCTKYMEGMVVIGRDTKGNQQNFCVFKDKSYLLNLK